MTRLRWNCKDRGCRLEQRWDPEVLDGCLPRGSSFGDTDAWVEIGGRFLFIEHKGVGVTLPVGGQRMALARLAEQPRTTVLLLRDRDDGRYDLRNMEKPESGMRVLTLAELREAVRAWGLRDKDERAAA